jgi:hypothetical protein
MNHIWLTHSQQYNFRAICFIANCHIEFRTYERFKKHIMYWRHEGDEIMVTNLSCDVPNCLRKLANLVELKSHYLDHLDIKNCPLPLDCIFQNCRNSYKYNEKSPTKTHLKKYHRDDTELVLRKEFFGNTNHTNESSLILEENCEDYTDQDCCENASLSEILLKSYSLNDIEEYFMKMYLKLNAKLLIPESSCEEILSSFSFLLNMNNKDITESINQINKQYNASVNLEPIYDNYILRHSLVKKVQEKFKSKGARKKWIIENKYYVAPIEQKLEHYNESDNLELRHERFTIGSNNNEELEEESIDETREEVFAKYEYVLKGL